MVPAAHQRSNEHPESAAKHRLAVGAAWSPREAEAGAEDVGIGGVKRRVVAGTGERQPAGD